jgi:integrative and conjugative element protein (TIGR02256 family)
VTFKRPFGGCVFLSPNALIQMEEYRQRGTFASEAGGILLGRIFPDSGDVHVDCVTTPNPSDQRSRFRFIRAAQPTQNAIESAWSESQGLQNYLGEWHTHPEDDPTPSSLDRRNWSRLARTATYEQAALFFIIVGRTSIRLWEVKRGGGKARALEEITT